MIIAFNELEKTVSIKTTAKEEKKGIVVNDVYSEVGTIKTHDDFFKFLDSFLGSEKGDLLRKGSDNMVIIPDSFIGFGYFDLPAFSKMRLKDVFEIKFKLSYSEFQNYYVDYFEYARTKTGTTYFYSICKKSDIEEFKSHFDKFDIKYSHINYFSKYIANYLTHDKNVFPHAVLIVGENNSEIIIHNGKNPVCASILDYGYNKINDIERFIETPYDDDNRVNFVYSNFVGDNFATKVPHTDENILKYRADSDLFSQKPRELRVLKDELLDNYTKKNNIRKFYSRVADVFDYYSKDPWFQPISEIIVFTERDFFLNFVETVEEFSTYKFIHHGSNISKIFELPIGTNVLFTKSLKAERRKLDWKKFLATDIGKKKKA